MCLGLRLQTVVNLAPGNHENTSRNMLESIQTLLFQTVAGRLLVSQTNLVGIAVYISGGSLVGMDEKK